MLAEAIFKSIDQEGNFVKDSLSRGS